MKNTNYNVKHSRPVHSTSYASFTIPKKAGCLVILSKLVALAIALVLLIMLIVNSASAQKLAIGYLRSKARASRDNPLPSDRQIPPRTPNPDGRIVAGRAGQIEPFVSSGWDVYGGAISPNSFAQVEFEMPTIVESRFLFPGELPFVEQGYSVTVSGILCRLLSIEQNRIIIIVPELPDGSYFVSVSQPELTTLTSRVTVKRLVPTFSIREDKPGNLPGTAVGFVVIGGTVIRVIPIVGETPEQEIEIFSGESLIIKTHVAGVHNPTEESYTGFAEARLPAGNVFMLPAFTFNRSVIPGNQEVQIRIDADNFPFNNINSRIKLTLVINGVRSSNFVVVRVRKGKM